MKNLEETIEKLNKYGQTHIVKIMEKLTEEEKEKLSDQIQKLDFENIKNLYNELTKEEVNVAIYYRIYFLNCFRVSFKYLT